MPSEIPAAVLPALRLLGPLHEEAAGGYWYSIKAVLKGHDGVAGFLLEQRLLEAGEVPAIGQGLVIQMPRGADHSADATFVFAETLAEAWSYLHRER